MDLLTPDWTKFVDEIVPNLIGLAKTNKFHGNSHYVSNIFNLCVRPMLCLIDSTKISRNNRIICIFQGITEFLKTLASQFELGKVQLDPTQAADLNALLDEFEIFEHKHLKA